MTAKVLNLRETTHLVFGLGVAFLLASFLSHQAVLPRYSAAALLALSGWLALSVNHVIDFGLGHTITHTSEGVLPVRSWRTHSLFTAPLWGAGVGAGSIFGIWFILSQVVRGISSEPPFALILISSFLGVVVAYSHLLPDSLTQAGIYFWRKRVALAHWRYDNPMANAAFIVLGFALLFVSLNSLAV